MLQIRNLPCPILVFDLTCINLDITVEIQFDYGNMAVMDWNDEIVFFEVSDNFVQFHFYSHLPAIGVSLVHDCTTGKFVLNNDLCKKMNSNKIKQPDNRDLIY